MKIRHTGRARPLALLASLAALLAVLLTSQAALAGATTADSRVFPPTSHPYGQGYGEWATDWWEWALNQPAATNPLTDRTGAQCANRQRGPVWFLAGGDRDPVERTCTVPKGKALFIPVLNNVYVAFETDPPAERTAAFVRDKARFEATGLSATIDGVAVPDVQSYFERSEIFSVELPAGNLFGRPADFLLDPCADEGYYLLVKPLTRGEHRISVEGTLHYQNLAEDPTGTRFAASWKINVRS
jgi:hypothetical protein